MRINSLEFCELLQRIPRLVPPPCLNVGDGGQERKTKGAGRRMFRVRRRIKCLGTEKKERV